MSFFADFTYEGSRSITGPYLGLLGASAFMVSVVSGAGEFLGYNIRFFSGRRSDQTGAPRDAMLSHAAKDIGYGWAFGVHEALDQFGALFGPLLVALVLVVDRHDYRVAFAALAVPAVIMLSLLTVARVLYPRPRDLGPEPGQASTGRLPRVFWIYAVGAALAAAGFADFPLIALHFQDAGTVSPALTPVFYSVAMAVSGTGSLVFGRMFDRAGIGVLMPLTIVTAVYAPLVFLGGFWAILAGSALWGLGMGVQESLIPAAVAPMVAQDRRASAYGLFTGIYGTAWVAGSAVIGILVSVSPGGLEAFCMACELAAIPLIWSVRRGGTR